MKVYQVLDRAARLMDRLGKASHIREDYRGRVCALGAIYEAANLSRWSGEHHPAIAAMASVLPTAGMGDDCTVALWSNTHTKATIVAGLKAQAAILKARESAEAPVVVSEAVGECVL